MHIQPISHLTLEMLRPVLEASLEEGYGFVQKLWDEYESGKATFRENGAILLGVIEHDDLIGIGGVHPDPYLNSPNIGRIRHVYVLPAYRRHGVGKELVEALIAHSSAQFKILTLRTQTEHGHAFYKAIGFSDEPRFENATHWIELRYGKDR